MMPCFRNLDASNLTRKLSASLQIYRANKADIFLTSLRTAEANVIFMRRNTSLIEVFPAATVQVHFVPIARVGYSSALTLF
mmetsp:Transcript_28292/g.111075  ORF Transcript_28292/g.111075 Transcript_28292/m.111075 type:complete len:81 (-) Transcript_28292:1222-1464(-)